MTTSEATLNVFLVQTWRCFCAQVLEALVSRGWWRRFWLPSSYEVTGFISNCGCRPYWSYYYSCVSSNREVHSWGSWSSSRLSSFFPHLHSNTFFFLFILLKFLISAIFLEYFSSTLLFIFTSIIIFHFFPEPCNFKKKKKQLPVPFSDLIPSHWGWLTGLCVLPVLCHILWNASPPFVTPILGFSGHTFSTLLEEFLFFVWENFLFYAVLVNHCCPFLKGWYGREASYHLRLLSTPWLCLQPQQGSQSLSHL